MLLLLVLLLSQSIQYSSSKDESTNLNLNNVNIRMPQPAVSTNLETFHNMESDGSMEYMESNVNGGSAAWSGQCVEDQMFGRVFPKKLYDSGDNTPGKCIQECAQNGYKLAGVQYSNECFCSMYPPPLHKLKPKSECNKACSGNSKLKCGGDWRMNVYSIGTESECPVGQPTLGSQCTFPSWISCKYGEEYCCGSFRHTITVSCAKSGAWIGTHTDACSFGCQHTTGVSCGFHRAMSCKDCPQGIKDKEEGRKLCKGDCVWRSPQEQCMNRDLREMYTNYLNK